MSLDTGQIAKAFCSYKFEQTYRYMAEGIVWTNVGGEATAGREAVIARCEGAKKFLETVTATIIKIQIHHGENFEVVQGAAEIKDQENNVSSVASCDVFEFLDDQLVAITSYVVGLNEG